MQISNIKNFQPSFGLKIVNNDNLEGVIHDWQVNHRWSKEKIKSKIDRIKAMAPDTYTLEFLNKPKTQPYFMISTEDKDAFVHTRINNSKYGTGWFLLRSIKKTCKEMIKINSKQKK